MSFNPQEFRSAFDNFKQIKVKLQPFMEKMK